MSQPDFYRRRILSVSLRLVPLAVLARSFPVRAAAPPSPATPPSVLTPPRALTLFNTHTDEAVTATFSAGGKYDPAVLARFNTVLRDHRSGEVGAIDPALFDYLFEVAERADAEPAFDVISGFRSPSSNELLRSRSSGVAKGSLHLQGKAVDVRLRGVQTAKFHTLALDLARGGVGYYPKSDFVHLDTGRVRHWAG